MHPEMGYKLCKILWKSRKGYAPVGHFYSTFWSNLSKISVLGLLYPNCCTGPLLHAKFHPIGETCRPAGRKTSKSASE